MLVLVGGFLVNIDESEFIHEWEERTYISSDEFGDNYSYDTCKLWITKNNRYVQSTQDQSGSPMSFLECVFGKKQTIVLSKSRYKIISAIEAQGMLQKAGMDPINILEKLKLSILEA